MTSQTQTALNQIAKRSALRQVRNAEFKVASARATTAVDKFWAGSAFASVLRDYQAGRVTVVKAG